MAIEGDQSQWLLAKARQMKERALGTADRTRRKQFLLIASEYQKLAQQEDGAIALNVITRALAPNDRTSHSGVVLRLGFAPPQMPATNTTPGAPLVRAMRALRRPEVLDAAIWAVLALVAFGLLLFPGDQTTQGLHELFELIAD
jgi:hypothetical protein